MLKTVQFENYRGFKSFRLEGLSRVNLLVGKNNCGKTSLLEGVNLLVSGGHPSVLLDSATHRGEMVPGNSKHRESIDLSHFFHSRLIHVDSRFSVSTEDGLDPVEVRMTQQHLDDRFSLSPNGNVLVAQINVGSPASANKQSFNLPISDRGALLKSGDEVRRYTLIDFDRFKAIRFITSDSLDISQLTYLWNQVLLEASEAEIIRALQILEPGIGSIVQLGNDFLPNHGDRSGFMISFNGDKKRVPLGSLGDGIRRMFAIALSLINCKDGYLIIDEIDTGLHYSIMADLWNLVIQTAERLNIQVFATTHSYDCLRGLSFLCKEEPTFRSSVSVQKIESNLKHSIALDGNGLIIVSDRNSEVR